MCAICSPKTHRNMGNKQNVDNVKVREMLLFPELSVNKCAGVNSVTYKRCRTCIHRFRFALNEHSNKIVQCCELQPSKRSNSGYKTVKVTDIACVNYKDEK